MLIRITKKNGAEITATDYVYTQLGDKIEGITYRDSRSGEFIYTSRKDIRAILITEIDDLTCSYKLTDENVRTLVSKTLRDPNKKESKGLSTITIDIRFKLLRKLLTSIFGKNENYNT